MDDDHKSISTSTLPAREAELWKPVHLPSRARAYRRFARRMHTPGVRPDDAWFWLAHPDQPGPSGSESPLGRLERARARQYRPQSTSSAHDAFRALQRVLAAERRDAIAAVPPTHSPSPRQIVVVGAVAALAVLIAAAVGIQTGTAGPAGPRQEPMRALTGVTPTAGPPVVGARTIRTTQLERSRLDRLFDNLVAGTSSGARFRARVQSDIDESADSPLAANGSDRAPSIVVPGGSGIGPDVFNPALGTGQAVTLAVVTDRPVLWVASLVFAGGTTIRVNGTASGGRYQYAVVLAPAEDGVRRLELQMPIGVHYSWQLLRRG